MDMIGRTLGQYHILEEIGRGGMAVVYRAHQPTLERQVAIKVLPRELSFDQEFVERFIREARAAARLSHPNIVTIHDVGQANDSYFIVMEYVDGPSVTGLLERQGALPLEQVTEILTQVASALDYAHDRGFVHRDIKPANILLGADQTAKLTDFGIVKAAEGTRLTRTGTLLGTPAYMSPEQARGTAITRSTDIYSLGVVAYEMLSGRVPFSGDTMAVLHAHAYDPPDLTVLPPAVRGVVGHALEKDATKRYPSAGALAEALRVPVSAPSAGALVSDPQTAPAERSTGRSRGVPVWLWGALGVSAALLVTAVVLAVSFIARWGAMGAATPDLIRTATPGLVEGTDVEQTESVPAVDPGVTPTGVPPTEAFVTPTLSPTPTSSPTALATEVPTETPAPTSTAPPTPTPCGVDVYSGFAAIYGDVEPRLGCPVQPARTNQWFGEEAFERGRMLWREDNRKIYVLYNTGAWQRFDDTWNQNTDPEFACGPAESPPTPKRGFGKVWCARADVRSGLGNAIEEEHGEWGAVQDFVAGGAIVRIPSGTYILFADGKWERR